MPPANVVVYEHADCRDHETARTGDEHQEGPSRLDAIRDRLQRLDGVRFTDDFPPATHTELSRVHSKAYIQVLNAIERDYNSGALDAVGPVSPGGCVSFTTVLRLCYGSFRWSTAC